MNMWTAILFIYKFIILCRFPAQQSIADMLTRRYNTRATDMQYIYNMINEMKFTTVLRYEISVSTFQYSNLIFIFRISWIIVFLSLNFGDPKIHTVIRLNFKGKCLNFKNNTLFN